MLNVSSNNLFARIQDNRILEWPLTYKEIQDRGEPLSLFKVIHYLDKPEQPPFYNLEETISLDNGTPVVSYKVTAIPLQEILNEVFLNKTGITGEVYLKEVAVSDIPSPSLKRIFELVRSEVSLRLDAFAQSRYYDNIATLVTYKDDPDLQQSLEGNRGLILRSQCWAAITRLEARVNNGISMLPRLEEDIFKLLPALTW